MSEDEDDTELSHDSAVDLGDDKDELSDIDNDKDDDIKVGSSDEENDSMVVNMHKDIRGRLFIHSEEKTINIKEE